MPNTKAAKKSKDPASPNTSPNGDLNTASAEADFKHYKKRFQAIPPPEVLSPKVDLQIAAVVALGVHRTVAAEPLRTRFKNLTLSGEYDDSCVGELPKIARAVWYARHRFLLEDATHSDARISLSLFEEASKLRATMLRCADYHLGQHPSEGPFLAAIRIGTGYQDLANDLLALCNVYKRQKSELAHDKRLYKSTDADTAKTLAHRILEELSAGTSDNAAEWGDLQARAWTLLLRIYNEVCRGGRFLCADQQAELLFPSLIGASRADASPKPEGTASAEASP